MRNEQEIFDLILKVSKKDERIRTVLLSGLKAIPNIPYDPHQDFDITYYVSDVQPYYHNVEWVHTNFGKPAFLQMPQLNQHPLLEPIHDERFVYLMIFEDGVRIDLTIKAVPMEAMDIYYQSLHPMLDQMIDWYIGAHHDFKVSTYKKRNYEKLLPTSIYSSYLDSFILAYAENLWKAIEATPKLFSKLAKDVSNNLNLIFNDEEETAALNYIRKIKTLI